MKYKSPTPNLPSSEIIIPTYAINFNSWMHNNNNTNNNNNNNNNNNIITHSLMELSPS
jgi:hypothetical protein